MSDEYTRGPSSWRTLPRLETKPSPVIRERWSNGERAAVRDTGGGYERWRSWEYDPTAPGEGKTDVYVSHHRLLAVIACYPEDMPVAEILTHLEGKDVHHTTGVEWANFGDSPNFDAPGIVVREHGRHASITQSQMRAWASDAKAEAEAVVRGEHAEDHCDGCNEPADTLAESPDWSGVRCLDCAIDEAGDEPIEVR